MLPLLVNAPNAWVHSSTEGRGPLACHEHDAPVRRARNDSANAPGASYPAQRKGKQPAQQRRHQAAPQQHVGVQPAIAQ